MHASTLQRTLIAKPTPASRSLSATRRWTLSLLKPRNGARRTLYPGRDGPSARALSSWICPQSARHVAAARTTCRRRTARSLIDGARGPARAARDSARAGTAAEQEAAASSDGDAATTSYQWEGSADMARAYAFLVVTLGAGNLAAVQELQFAYVAYFTSLAATTIYIGAHRSLCEPTRRSFGLQEAWQLPIGCSLLLLTIYLAGKYLPDLSLSAFVSAYCWLLGCFAIGGNLVLPAEYLARSTALAGVRVRIPLPPGLLQDDDRAPVSEVDTSGVEAGMVVAGVGLSTFYFTSGAEDQFGLSNLIAIFIVVDTLRAFGLRSYRSAAALLVGLLLYDAFWVFGSSSVFGDNVMMTVATSDQFSGPIKGLMFPRWEDVLEPAPEGRFPFALLGLGDVAVPGLLAALLLRFDAARQTDMRARAVAAASAFTDAFDAASPAGYDTGQVVEDAASAAESAYDDVCARLDSGELAPAVPEEVSVRTYFNAALGAYVAGLGAAFAANYVTGAGQPALVYICPATLGASLYVANRQRDLRRLWEYTAEDPPPKR